MLRGKCALVTGSVSGLGYALAEGLAGAGANLVVNGLCEPGEGEAMAARVAGEYGVEAMFDSGDLRHPDEIERMTIGARQRFGAIDIVVNNAVVRHFSPIEHFRPNDWDDSIAVNLSAAFHAVRLTLPDMKQRGWGRIINVSSFYGWRGAENRIDYVTTKTALLGMTRAVAVETARTGVTCNAICPGTVLTPAIRGKIEKLAEEQGLPVEEVIQSYAEERSPAGRFVPVANVAAVVAFLCGPAGADITGVALPIDGGWLAA